jgi:DNA-binding response OmpR family regulator
MARLLEQALGESGFAVTVAANGLDGLSRIDGQDALIVDVMMPFMTGFEMVEQLRRRGVTTPVLFLTAKGATKDIVEGFNIGAHDYITKPFVLAELIARLNSAIQRSSNDVDELRVSDLWLDRRGRQARRGEVWLYLSATEFALLELLMLKPGKIISKATILQEVWHEAAYRDDNIVEVYINYLRKKLEAMGQSRVVVTVKGRGYKLECEE